MFDQYGEFDSCEELNQAAAGFLEEGDEESLLKLARENGIDEEDVRDYLDGCVPELSNHISAALGRLEVQRKEIAAKNTIARMPLMVIFTMLHGMCTEEQMAAAVMKKGKRITAIYEAMRGTARKHMDKDQCSVCCGTDRELAGIIRAYYLEPEKGFKAKIEELYKEKNG